MVDPASSTSEFQHSPKYRAPEANGRALVEPSLARVLHHRLGVGAVQQQLPHFQLGKRPVESLRELARREAWEAAVRYTSSYRNLWFDPSIAAQSALSNTWIVAGHQPELFHPGVWFKNFLLSQASQQTTCVALNLVIDNDLCRSPAIRVPVVDSTSGVPFLRTESVAFDSPSPPVAWECRSVLDQELLKSFPGRVAQAAPSSSRSLLHQLWPHAIASAGRTGRLGLALAQARHALEGDLGLQTLELPLSELCQQRGFAEFSLAVLADLPRFQDIYNQQRELYRLANGIRSQSHPVQALQTRHGWFEAPWWVYREAEPTRRRLFVRVAGENLILSDQAGWQEVIEGPLDGDEAVQDWLQLAVDGVLLRPRALITTMFVRLVISDLFVHGIGGGKYDQMTDAIIRHYFEVPAPTMVVATATMRLPLAEQLQLRSLTENAAAQQLETSTAWQLRHHPEQHIQSVEPEVESLLNRKRELLANIPPRGQKWEWHREITRLNQRLAHLNEQAIQQSQQRLQELAAQSRQLKLATSREFSFCLFESESLVRDLRRLAADQFDLPAAK